MNDEKFAEEDTETQTHLILLAASRHDILALKPLLRNGSANVQDLETGFTPLHAAVAACNNASPSIGKAEDANAVDRMNANGSSDGVIEANAANGVESDVTAAAKTMKLLLQSGAIWNDVDKKDETPGCLALRLGLKELYEILVDAGVRAEMLLNRLDEYQPLTDGGLDQENEEGKRSADEVSKKVVDIPGDNDTTAEADDAAANAHIVAVDKPFSNEDYLQASLHFQDGNILDDDGNSVMMAWETDIMRRSADLLCPAAGLQTLNVGHGLGIIDHFFQSKNPSAHHIIEAHPQILDKLRRDGWYEKPSVAIHEGRWQDVVPKLMQKGILFDAIYFDTFAEDYKAFRDFFSDCLIGLLDDGGKWGFFNGMGADRQICYDVYTKVVEMDLFEAGFDTAWETIPVPEMGINDWKGVKRRYWYVSVVFICPSLIFKWRFLIDLSMSSRDLYFGIAFIFTRASLIVKLIYRSLRDYKLPSCTFIV